MTHRAEGFNDIFESDLIVRGNLSAKSGTIPTMFGQTIFNFGNDLNIDLAEATLTLNYTYNDYLWYDIPTIKSQDGGGGFNMNIDGGLLISTTANGHDNTNGIYIYVADDISSAAPEIDFIVGANRMMVFGYDHQLLRSLFYNDSLGGGMFFFDNEGIALGFDQSGFENNIFRIPKSNDQVYFANNGKSVTLVGDNIAGSFDDGTNTTLLCNTSNALQTTGNVCFVNLPTSTAGLTAGQIWKDTANGNVIKII